MSTGLMTKQAAAPSIPAANKSIFYIDANRRMCQIDDNGVISVLSETGLQDRNVLTNGGLMVQQRVATASTAIPAVSTTTRAGQVADRWAVTTGNATTTSWAQIDAIGAPETGLVSRYYGKITQATNAAKFIFSQFIIASDMAHLRGQRVRLSVKLKNFVGSNQTYKLGLLQLTTAGTVDVCPAFTSAIGADGVAPTWGTNLSAITPDASPTPENGTVNGSYVDITSTAAWVRSSATFTVPSDCKNLVWVLWKSAAGGATDSTGIAELQLTSNLEVIDFVQPPLAEELIRCQRFYCKTFAATTVPVTNVGINKGELMAVAGKAGAVANACIFAWRFPVTMWKTPVTVTLYNPAAANALGRNITGTADLGATALTAQLDASVIAISTGVAATAVGDQCGIHITADAELVA